MKAVDFFKIFSLALLAFFNATISYSITLPADSGLHSFIETDTLQQDQHAHPLYYEEAPTHNNYQIKFEDYPPVCRLYSGSSSNGFGSSDPEANSNLWTFTPNLRDSLKDQIFPFHFFW